MNRIPFMVEIRRLRLWLRTFLRPRQVEKELGDEFRLHIELETRKNLRAGMNPARARRKAMLDFGGEERFKEQTRDARSTRPLENLFMDLRYGFRQLRKHPGFTSVALLSLALGIGANTAIFSIVNAVLLRPLPVPEPEQVVALEELSEGEANASFSPMDFLDLKNQNRSFQGLVGYRGLSMSLTGFEAPERIQAMSVSPDFFQVLGVRPALGRVFDPGPEVEPEGLMVVLTYGAWQSRFGGDPQILGRTLTLDGRPHLIVGVAPRSFDLHSEAELWVRSYRARLPEPPIDVGDDLASVRGLGYFSVWGRLSQGVTVEDANAELALLAQRIEEVDEDRGDYTIRARSLQDTLVGEVRVALLVLLGAVGLVLLIACANVANLLLARAAARTQELSVRAALGAGRRRLFQQLLVESLLLGFVAGCLGLVMAKWGFGALLFLVPNEIPRLNGIPLNSTVLVFTLGISLITGLVFGLVPALEASRGNLAGSMREGGRGMAGGGRSRRTRELLVMTEVALSVVLLTGSGLLLKSLVRLQEEDLGFSSEGVLAIRLSLPESRYPDQDTQSQFVREMLDGVEAIPGVRSAGVSLAAPFTGGAATLTYEVEGEAPREGEGFDSGYQVVTPGYFRALGLNLLVGRFLEPADGEGEGGARTVVVNEAFAKRHWGEASPLGRRVSFFDDTPMEIVGVVGNVRHFSYETAPRPEAYVSFHKDPWPFMTLVLKADGNPLHLADPVREVVQGIDPAQPVYGVQTMDEALAASTGQRRFTVELFGLFALLAIALAVVGVYGVMAYTMTLRRREISIRVAMGAPRKRILWLSLGSGIRLAAVGILVGAMGSALVTRTLGSLLYGVSPTDPGVLALASAALSISVLTAAYLPARRAAALDPATVLRGD